MPVAYKILDSLNSDLLDTIVEEVEKEILLKLNEAIEETAENLWTEVLKAFPEEGEVKIYDVCPERRLNLYLGDQDIPSPVSMGVSVRLQLKYDAKIEFAGIYRGGSVRAVANADLSADIGYFISAIVVRIVFYLKLLLL